jgi:phosphatidylserine/phosphatidylglycerophosphate/cardiolipin synthase-like enzyme
LGFAIERSDPAENERYYVFGFKVFPSLVPQPDQNTTVKTYDHPIQSFVWDDFTAKPDRVYEYISHPLKGTPKNLDRSAKPISIRVRTEPLFSKLEHDVFFNRGVASSQAYARKFHNLRPDKLPPQKQAEALKWLSRDLDTALLKFIANAAKGDTLLCCFYEFRYDPVAEALREAQRRGVDVTLIVDAKRNANSFPRKDNLELIKDAGFPKKSIILREAKPSNIQHNKFMVLLKGKSQTPKEVWTGSTNISDSGIHGQTNVGHWVRDEAIASKFKEYWELLSADPGPKRNDDRSTSQRKNAELRESVEAICDTPEKWEDIAAGVTPIFSPRGGPGVLEMYAQMVGEAQGLSCITLAFGISKVFKDVLSEHTARSHIAFFLLEKEDKPNRRSKEPFVALTARNNVYEAWGSYLEEPLYQWGRETYTKKLKLSQHVSYIHSKFLLMDPLAKNPVVVTGSANFSKASTNDNDENMLVDSRANVQTCGCPRETGA